MQKFGRTFRIESRGEGLGVPQRLRHRGRLGPGELRPVRVLLELAELRLGAQPVARSCRVPQKAFRLCRIFSSKRVADFESRKILLKFTTIENSKYYANMPVHKTF